MANIIVPTQTIPDFSLNEAFGLFARIFGNPFYSLTEGSVYTVEWDGNTYTCVAESTDAVLEGSVSIGNLTDFGGSGNNEPFVIVDAETLNILVSLTDTEDNTPHTITVYEGVYEPEAEPEIILKGYGEEDFKFPSETVEKVALNNTDGEEVIFSKGDALSGMQINLDFSDGNQELKAPEGYLVKQATIVKPDTLTPENIVKDVEVAGVVGSAEMGSGGQFEEGIVSAITMDVNVKASKLTIQSTRYADLYNATGSYDVIIPDKLGGYGVIINSTSVYSSVLNAPYAVNVIIGDNVGWLNNSMVCAFNYCSNMITRVNIPNYIVNLRNTFYGCKEFNQPLTIPVGVNDMYATFSNCYKFNQPITIPNNVTNMSETFRNCYSFNQPITIPNGVTSMYSTFYYCNSLNQPITISDGVNNVAYAFCGCESFDQNVVIPKSVTNMASCFMRCTNLTRNITIPNGVTSVNATFRNCNNLSGIMTIPESVTDMSFAFGHCHNLTEVHILSNNVSNTTDMFNNRSNALRINVYIPAGSTTNTKFFNTKRYYTVVGGEISWTTDSYNNCRYNTLYNIYGYWV